MFHFDSLDEALAQLAPCPPAYSEPEDDNDQFTDEEPTEASPVLSTALAYLRSGVSVLPIRADGSKSPAISRWSWLQQERMTEQEVRRHFNINVKVGVICGAISGHLEVIDFDEPDFIYEFLDAAALLGFDRSRFVIVKTPSGGHHLYYRHEGQTSGNLKLAMTEDHQVRIETRGEGGYVVGADSQCCPSGNSYRFIQGDLDTVTVLTASEREQLLGCARSFNRDVRLAERDQAKSERGETAHHPADMNLRPGDDYNQRTEWADVLGPLGWKQIGSRGGTDYWQRSGKEGKTCSATTNHGGSDRLHVFSSNGFPFEQDTSYSKFAAYAVLNHSGDFATATRKLASEGYGDKITRRGNTALVEAGSRSISGLREYHQTDVGNAQRLVDGHGQNIRYVPNIGWHIFNGKKWVSDDTGGIYRFAKESVLGIYHEASLEPDDARRKALVQHASRSQNHNRITAMVSEAQTEPEMPLRVSELDADTMRANCLNGTLDLTTGAIGPHRREDYCTKSIPVSYDPLAVCPLWEACLERFFAGNRQLIDYLQRAIGSCLTGETRDQCLFVLYGQGANGKSTFIETIRAMLGDYALETPPETLMAKRNEGGISNDVARLKGARFVSARESEENQRFSESLVKSLTGGDTITARFLHREFFEFKPQFKVWLATNHRPDIRGTDEGIWRRIHLIPFEVFIPPAERDPNLLPKLREELPGILAWAVRGCLQWQQQGLGQPEAVKAATDAYRAEMDTLGSFIQERCYLGESIRIPANELYTAYKRWCEDNSEYVLTKNALGRRLSDRGLKPDKCSGTAYRRGIGLLQSSEYPVG